MKSLVEWEEMYEGLPFSATSKVVCTNGLRQIQWNFLGDIQFCSNCTHMPLKTKPEDQMIIQVLAYSTGICGILSQSTFTWMSHMWPELLWECVFNSLSLAVCFFFFWLCPPISSPLRELRPENQKFPKLSASVAVVISVRKDGDGIWWDSEQCEILLPRNPREDFRQIWNSYHARGVVAYSISQTRKPLEFNWEVSCCQPGA